MRAVHGIWDHLGLLSSSTLLTYDINRIIVPRGVRRELIQIAHLGHMGIVCTYQSLCICYYWKHMKRDVEVALLG